jgi:alpha-1,6-mannosyltransferase
MRVLIVSSFVLPHAGGVEQFVATVRGMLEARGHAVRVLACRRPGEDGGADIRVASRFAGRGDWPVPVGGWRALWRAVAHADAVIANNATHVLSAAAVVAARRQGVPALLVVHGSGQAQSHRTGAARLARAAFARTLPRLALRRAMAVSVSGVGVAGIARTHGVDGAYLPYPLLRLPPAPAPPPPGDAGELRVAWIGRLSPEKDPLLCVSALDATRQARPVSLDVYGTGPMRGELQRLAAARPWVRLHGSRPWREVLEAQAHAHVCLSTSAWDNVQVAVLEALARGVPVVCTDVGESRRHFRVESVQRFCVASREPERLAAELSVLAAGYDGYRRAFAENGRRIRAAHGDAAERLEELIGHAANGRARR